MEKLGQLSFTPVPAFILDRKGCIIDANSLAVEWFCADGDYNKGIEIEHFIKGSSGSLVKRELLNQFLAASQLEYLEYPMSVKSGIRWVGQYSRLFKDSEGKELIGAVAIDISAQIKAKEQISRSEEKYRGIIQNSSLGLLEVDLNEIILFANRAFCEISGYQPEELIGQKANELLLPKEPEIAEKMKNVQIDRSSGVANAYEIQIRKKDGTNCWVLISGAPVYDHTGQVVGSIGIHHDISDQKRQNLYRNQLLAELDRGNRDLKRRQDHLTTINIFAQGLLSKGTVRDVYRHISDSVRGRLGFIDCVVYYYNNNTNTLEVDPGFTESIEPGSIGYTPLLSMQLGQGITGICARDKKTILVENTESDARYIKDRLINYATDGKMLVDMDKFSNRLSELAVPILYDGEILGVLDTGHPEKKFFDQLHIETLETIARLAGVKIAEVKANRSLKENEVRIRSVLDSSLDPVMTLDSAGKIREASRRSEEMFGERSSQMRGKSINDFLTTNSRFPLDFFRAIGDLRHQPPERRRVEAGAVRADGTEFLVELSMAPVVISGENFLSLFIRDITLRKKAENELRLALAREAELNSMKTRFITMASHEFRTPLTTIQSTIEILSMTFDGLGGQLKPKIDKYFHRIIGEIDRLTRLMNDILVIGRIDAEKVTFSPVEFDLPNLLQELLQSQTFVKNDNRQISLKFIGTAKKIKADPTLLGHVMTNLLSNALKYSMGRPAPELMVDFSSDVLKIRVKDYGVGIPSEEQKNLFETFFRASNVENIQGTGLGLVIAKQFVEIHGGKIEVRSEENIGTEFTVSLPYLTGDKALFDRHIKR